MPGSTELPDLLIRLRPDVPSSPIQAAPRARYLIHDEIGAGGMATVHLGRLHGAAGFSRVVAIKRLQPSYARDREFVSMLIDEARLSSRIRHPCVVAVLDVVHEVEEVLLVMEYVEGESLSNLLHAAREQGTKPPFSVVTRILVDVLHGLHAAHEARTETGAPLEIVHRDVSPQNVLVGIDGLARVFDFGIAKATSRAQTTRDGQIKGKLRYMAPEQLAGQQVTRRTDVYAAAVVLWEALTGRRLFEADHEGTIYGRVMEGVIEPPSALAPGLPKTLDEIVMRALARHPDQRFESAQAMAVALEGACPVTSALEVSAWVTGLAGDTLDARARRVAELEAGVVDEPVATSHPVRKDAKTATAAPRRVEIGAPRPVEPFPDEVRYRGFESRLEAPSSALAPSSSHPTPAKELPAPRWRAVIGACAAALALGSAAVAVHLLAERRAVPPPAAPDVAPMSDQPASTSVPTSMSASQPQPAASPSAPTGRPRAAPPRSRPAARSSAQPDPFDKQY